MKPIHSIQELFDLIPKYFEPEEAGLTNTSIQFDITGDEGGQWFVHVKDGKLAVEQGLMESPDMQVSVTAQNLLSIVQGRLNPMTAFMGGKIKVTGDLSRAYALQKLFRLPS